MAQPPSKEPELVVDGEHSGSANPRVILRGTTIKESPPKKSKQKETIDSNAQDDGIQYFTVTELASLVSLCGALCKRSDLTAKELRLWERLGEKFTKMYTSAQEATNLGSY